MIAYAFKPSEWFLRRGALRTYFLVSNEWRRLTWLSWLLIAGFTYWSLSESWHRIEAFPEWVQVATGAVVATMYIVGFLGARTIYYALSLIFGPCARPVQTRVKIVPGGYVRWSDMSDTMFDWRTLTRAQAFPDMYVLIFRTSPFQETPIFVSRDHLTVAEDDALAAALAKR